jgi:hypothetical protein
MNFKEKLSAILGAGMEPELKELKIQEILDAIDATTIPVTHDSLRLAEILTLYGEDKIGLHTAIVEIEEYVSHPRLKLRSDKLELLKRYTDFLLKNGYTDTDVYAEPPTAIDEFMKTEPSEQPPPQLTGEAVYDEINALLKIDAGFDMEHPTTHRVCRAIADLVYKYSSHPVEITYGAIEEFWTDKMRWQGMGFSVAQEKLAKRIIRAAIKKFSHPTQLLSEDRMVEIIGKHIRVASGDLREGVREALVEMKGR